jgi:hypothetical protein
VEAGPQRVTNVPRSSGGSRAFAAPELAFQFPGGERWRVASTLPPAAQGRFAVSEKASLLAYTHTTDMVRLLDARTGATLCDLAAPEPHPVVEMAMDASGDTLVVLVRTGLIQIWDLAQLRLELAKTGLDWPNPSLPDPSVSRSAR